MSASQFCKEGGEPDGEANLGSAAMLGVDKGAYHAN